MNSGDFESPASPTGAQETANASSSYTVAATPINCSATTGSKSSVGNIIDQERDSITSNNSTEEDTMKVFTPVIANDMNSTNNAAKKVPMVMVPVTDSRTLMAIPISSFSQSELKKVSQMNSSKDEQQARDLLNWNEGVGTLEGCDLRFRVNQLGCLELLDSDDELENQTTNKMKTTKSQNAISRTSNQSGSCGNNSSSTSVNNKKASTSNIGKSTTTATNNMPAAHVTTSNGISETSQQLHQQQNQLSANEKVPKRAKLDPEPAPIKQISPGSSLLRDGPNTARRPKSGSSSSGRNQTNSLALLKKLEQNQNAMLVEKLFPREKIEEMKKHVSDWTLDDVRDFIDSIPGCSGYGDTFKSEWICGKSLLQLDQRDITQVIEVKFGPAVKIYNLISQLK